MDLVGSGWIYGDLLDLGGSRRMWVDLGGSGRIWEDLSGGMDFETLPETVIKSMQLLTDGQLVC